MEENLPRGAASGYSTTTNGRLHTSGIGVNCDDCPSEGAAAARSRGAQQIARGEPVLALAEE